MTKQYRGVREKGVPCTETLSVSRHAGLAAGFGVRCGIVGARGMDENGAFFQSSLNRAHVSTEHLRVLKGGSTGEASGSEPLPCL
jgi:hypothetical protein